MSIWISDGVKKLTSPVSKGLAVEQFFTAAEVEAAEAAVLQRCVRAIESKITRFEECYGHVLPHSDLLKFNTQLHEDTHQELLDLLEELS